MTVSAKLADWSLLQEPGVMEAAERAARKVARLHRTFEVDDLLQETYILLAERTETYRSAIERDSAGGLGLMTHELSRDLGDRIKRESGRRARTESYEAHLESLDDERQ